VRADLLDFEGLGDLEAVDGFYPGVTFRNAIAEIAGFTLNDAEFPPASGVTVAVPNNGQIIIEFDSQVTSFEGLFTHSAALTLRFFLGDDPVGAATSTFINNLAISGDAGTTPNETIFFERELGFDSVHFVGGGFYAVDDISFDAALVEVPEPKNITMTGICMACILFCLHRRSRPATKTNGADRWMA
jgi:hypothetical protein